MGVEHLEAMLQKARTAWKRLLHERAKEGRTWQLELHAASEAMLRAERELAAAKGESYAVPLDFPVVWDGGAPMPHLFCNDNRTFLVFYEQVVDPNWDGSYVVMREARSPKPQALALVQFHECRSARMGTPNDEVFHGHLLYGKGFEGHRAMEVIDSNWVKELERINSVHSQYRPEPWKELKHYILPFHDVTFECVAKRFSVEKRISSLRDLLAEVCDRLIQ